MKIRFAFVLAIALLSTAVSISPVSAAPDVRSEAFEIDGFEIEELVPMWQTTRSDLALESLSDARLVRIAKSKSGSVRTENWGFPLTRSEEAELIARDLLSEQLHFIDIEAQKLESYAGAYLDVKNGKARIVVTSTERLRGSDRRNLRLLVDENSRIGFEHGQRSSYQDLNEAAAALYEGLDESNPIHTIGVDYRNNQIHALADMGDSLQARNARQMPSVKTMHDVPILIEEAPAPVHVACNTRENCDSPFRGGIRVTNRANGGECSSAFVAEDRSNANFYLLTAGHCGTTGQKVNVAGRIGGNGIAEYYFHRTARFIDLNDSAAIRIDAPRAAPRLFRTFDDRYRAIKKRGWQGQISDFNYYCVHGLQGSSGTHNWKRRCGNVSPGLSDVWVSNLGTSVDTPDIFGGGIDFLYQSQFVINLSLPGRWYCDGVKLLSDFNDAANAGDSALANEISNSNVVTGVSGGAITNWNGETAVGIASTCSNAAYGEAINRTTLRITGQRIRDVEDTLNVQVLTTG